MPWPAEQRNAYAVKHIKSWCSQILGVPAEEISLTNGRTRHLGDKSKFHATVIQSNGQSWQMAFEVAFLEQGPAPRLPHAQILDPKSGQWFDAPGQGQAEEPKEAPPAARGEIKLTRTLTILFLGPALVLGLYVCGFQGMRLAAAISEGLWAYTWQTAEGVRNEGGYTFSFTLTNQRGEVSAYTSPFYNTHTRLRGGGELGSNLLEKASYLPELRRTPLKVYVNPLDPKRSVLALGVPLLAAYQLLLLMIILVPLVRTILLLNDARKTGFLSKSRIELIFAAGLFYILSTACASLYIGLYAYLLRSTAPAWPLLVWTCASGALFFFPQAARWLYGFQSVRRAIYLCIIGLLLPLAAIPVGLALPYVLAAVVGVMMIIVLLKPLARVGHSPLYALLISLFWVPVFVAGLLAPSRALVQLLHEVIAYMPYSINFTGIENPRIMAWFDVSAAVAGILLAVLATYMDSLWRGTQAAQVKLLPTSKARSVAVGLVELQGRARHVSPSRRGPVLQYDSRNLDRNIKEPFYLEDDTGRILIDPRQSRFRTRWTTSFGGRITEIALNGREQLAELFSPHVMKLLPGDQVYVLGTAQPNPDATETDLDSERLVVRRRGAGFFSSPFWRMTQGEIKPDHGAEGIFFISDSREAAAHHHIMMGLWQVWLWALLWIVMSLTMFHFQMPRTEQGYELWSMQEIIQYAEPDVRLAAVVDFFEHWTGSSAGAPSPAVLRFIRRTPWIGPYVAAINENLMHAQFTDGVNFLWDHHFDHATPAQVELLIRAARAKSRDLRWWGTARLGEPIAYPDLVVPVLIHSLEYDEDPTVRSYAASSLAKFGSAALPAVPALVRAARASDIKVRKSAVWTLTRMERIPEGPAHVLFLELVADKDGWARQAGVKGLQAMDHHDAAEKQVLLALTRDPDRYTRSLAIEALSAIAPNLPGFSDAVISGLSDREDVVRQSAVSALARLDTIPADAAAPLGSLIADKHLGNRILNLLSKMEERAAPAVPYLARALSHKDKTVAYNAAFALSRVGSAAAPALDELIIALEHPDKFVRRYSAQALGACGSDAMKAIPALKKLQDDPDPHVSGSARWAIQKISQAP